MPSLETHYVKIRSMQRELVLYIIRYGVVLYVCKGLVASNTSQLKIFVLIEVAEIDEVHAL